MMGEASEQYPPNKLLIHVYVADVDKTYQRALDAGCTSIDKPSTREGDPDKRGSFTDFAGNIWSIGTQQ
jgi:PhnB protein